MTESADPSFEERANKITQRAHAENPEQFSMIINEVKTILRDAVDEKQFIYVGRGAEKDLGITWTRFRLIVHTLLEEEEYNKHYLKLERPDAIDPENPAMIVIKVLTKDSVTYQEVWNNRDKILKMWADAQLNTKN